MPTAIKHITRTRRASQNRKVNLRVTSVSLTEKKSRYDTSKQVSASRKEDAISLGSMVPIEPTYPPDTILDLYETSNSLGSCVEAYVTNIARYGWEIVPVDGENEDSIDPRERELLQSFIDSPNFDETLATVVSTIVRYRERLGYSFMEVIRNRKKSITILRAVEDPAAVRILPRGKETVPVTYDIRRGPESVNVTELRKFRRYVQEKGGAKVYFKEFGDPRSMSGATGEYAVDGTRFPLEEEATELVHFKQPSDDAYGVPRWIGQLPSVLGSRESEEVNLNYFRENTIPPMMLTISGGRLTGESFRSLQKILNEQALGKARQHKILLLEAVPERETLDDKGNVTIRLDKLTDARQSDGLFSKYDEDNRTKVRSSFRLPPVAVGLSQDVTFATANVSSFIAETQVYHPERLYYSERINKTVVQGPSGLRVVTAMLRLKAPPIINPEMRVKAFIASNVMGAVTPRIAADMLNDLVPNSHPGYPMPGEDGYADWMDKPLSLSLRIAGQRDVGGLDVESEASAPDNTIGDAEDGDVGLSQPENGQQ